LPYCYARDIAERLYPQKFAPSFHPDRLAGPSRVTVPEQARRDLSYRNIFANSMSDLFGKWAPTELITATIDMASRNARWNFLTLTKFPQRAADFEFPANWWMGTTVDAQARVENAERAFEKIRCATKWLSLEPLLEPLRFSRLDLFQWVVIGGASPSQKTPEWVPPYRWFHVVNDQALTAGLRVYHKTNLHLDDRMRLREFPWTEPPAPRFPKSFLYLKGMSASPAADPRRRTPAR
jgi:protein gp37